MSEPFVFDSQHESCKSPFGAVLCGQTITFHCRPTKREQFTKCTLVFYHEFSKTTQEVELIQDGEDGDRVRFSAQVAAPTVPELSWYHFRFGRADGTGCTLDKTGYHSREHIAAWQLTTYRPSYTPKWFGEGVSYQIFPDRFHRLSVPSPKGMVGNRLVHKDWDDAPIWRPEANGEVANRDFFGGSLEGVMEKLDYLESLGVTTIYFCPIFESASNHRYNTADYAKIDPMLGTDEDFRKFCDAAHKRGMKILLDGVFNHIGSQSIYFNADGFYPTLGAAQSQKSPYYNWFSFHPWPTSYDSWWGFRTLPAVQEESESYVDYMVTNENSIIRRWLRAGVDGWRLDVADELPDSFIEKIRAVVDETKPDALLIGEVWEDASNKVAYAQRRKYLLGNELHGVMNYPFRTSLLAWLMFGDAAEFKNTMENLRENYPPDAFYSAMNFLGTHDTARILTVLGSPSAPDSKEARSTDRLTPEKRKKGIELMKLAVLVLFTFPGSPTIYYGDEAGMEGWEDPFNRGTYPWGKEEKELLDFYKKLTARRCQCPSLQKGDLKWLMVDGSLLVYAREVPKERLVTVVNAGDSIKECSLPWPYERARDLLSGRIYYAENGKLELFLRARSGMLLI